MNLSQLLSWFPTASPGTGLEGLKKRKVGRGGPISNNCQALVGFNYSEGLSNKTCRAPSQELWAPVFWELEGVWWGFAFLTSSLVMLLVRPDLENTGICLRIRACVRWPRQLWWLQTQSSNLVTSFYIINLAIMAGCSVAFVWDIVPHEQPSKNPRIFLSLEGVTPLQQRTSTLITYCHCFSWTHEAAVEDHPCTCRYAVTLAGTDWSKLLSEAVRWHLFWSLLQLFTLYIPTCTHFSLKHSHYAKITEPRGVQVINCTLCQN